MQYSDNTAIKTGFKVILIKLRLFTYAQYYYFFIKVLRHTKCHFTTALALLNLTVNESKTRCTMLSRDRDIPIPFFVVNEFVYLGFIL